MSGQADGARPGRIAQGIVTIPLCRQAARRAVLETDRQYVPFKFTKVQFLHPPGANRGWSYLSQDPHKAPRANLGRK